MFRGSGAVFVAWLWAGCAKPIDTGVALTPSTLSTSDPTVCERLLACTRDPRVRAGDLSTSGCAVSDLFDARLGAFGQTEASPSLDAIPTLLGPRTGVLTRACVARFGRAERMLSSGGRTGRASCSRSSETPSVQLASSVAPCLARLPLDSFRRDRMPSGTERGF